MTKIEICVICGVILESIHVERSDSYALVCKSCEERYCCPLTEGQIKRYKRVYEEEKEAQMNQSKNDSNNQI